jgi:SH3-like domain-containing protein
LDWSTRRKPFGAIVAWSSLAIFAVMSILGIAGVVMGLQPKPVAMQTQTAALETQPAAPVEERLPGEHAFGEAEPVAVPEAAAELQTAATSDDLIASTFEQLVEPVVVPADQVPAGAVAVTAETQVTPAGVELPMSQDQAVLTGNPPIPVGRNAAAWAIESEVPDGNRNTTALGYAAQPDDDVVRVGDSSINVRSGPAPTNRKLFALAAGAEVDVTGRSGNWVAITDERDRDGWVDGSLLENVELDRLPVVKDVPAAEPEKPATLRKVAGSGVTVRAGPGKSNKALFNLSGGAEVTVLDDNKGWLKVEDADGRTGWAYQSYIRG